MGFCFNRPLNMLSNTQASTAQHKRKHITQTKIIHNPDVRLKRRLARKQLSAKDRKFLQSIGLRVRN